jgi:hypothetical protein
MRGSAVAALRWIAVVALLVPGLTLLPIVLWKVNLPFISSSAGPELRVFEIFAFLVTVTALAAAGAALRRIDRRRIRAVLPVALFAGLACFYVGQIANRPQPSPDWSCYEGAARAVVAGVNPYEAADYRYPPLTALTLAATHRAVHAGAALTGIAVDDSFAWQGVFYLYQCAQFFLVMAAIGLCFLLARRRRTDPATASVLIAILFVSSVPLMRTLQFQQVNLWLLDWILVAVLFVNAPLVAGLAVAVAVHVKLYAAVLFLPFLLLRKFAAVAWALAGIAGIVVVQTAWGTNTALWRQYLQYVYDFTPGVAFRDNSLYSVVSNTLALGGRVMGVDGPWESGARILTALGTIGVLIYVGRRAFIRERSFAVESRLDERAAAARRLHGHAFDAIAFALIASPIVWEHHYVLAIPLVLLAVLEHGRRRPWVVGWAAFLIGVVPVFDVYPFSYHRLAGLLLLLAATPPTVTEAEPAGAGRAHGADGAPVVPTPPSPAGR